MKKLIILILLIMISFPAMNQDTNQNLDKDKDVTKFRDVFDRRDNDENYPDEYDVEMYKEESKLKPLKKEQKIVWAYRTAKKNPFI